MTFLESLKSSRLLGILRGLEFDEIDVVCRACADAQLKFVEITMNTPNAAEKISMLRKQSGGAFQVGAGTVLTHNQFREAVDAGASFIVSPVLVPEVAQAATAERIPFLPGALTPQDIFNCHTSGATIVKVFPIQCFGPSYIRELRGPFNDIPLLACGGIRPDNLEEYLVSGASAVAIGSGTFKREWLRNKDRQALTAALSALTALANSTATTR